MTQIQRELKGHVFNSFGSHHSRGVAIIIDEKIDCEIVKTKCGDDGRKILITLKLDDEILTLVNVYAPNQYKERELFFTSLKNWIFL